MAAAQNGINSPDNDMKFYPGDAAAEDKNLFWTILEGSRGGDIGNSLDGGEESFLLQLLDQSHALSRNHSKTDESARKAFYTVHPSSGSTNLGIIQQKQPQNMVTYFENKLILAEAAARMGQHTDGLSHLNAVRAWLNEGGNLNENFDNMAYNYAAFEADDFEGGGIENTDNITPKLAFLREVIEERYVSSFGMHMPFNDARRLRKSDGNIAVPNVLNDGPMPPYPERMPYGNNEINFNSNAPENDPGIFIKTKVNQ